jgi:hypothetical protein
LEIYFCNIFYNYFQILDLRDTAIGDSEVGCFSSTKTLTHLYLECPSTLSNEEMPKIIREQLRQRQTLRLPTLEDDNLVQVLIKIKLYILNKLLSLVLTRIYFEFVIYINMHLHIFSIVIHASKSLLVSCTHIHRKRSTIRMYYLCL